MNLPFSFNVGAIGSQYEIQAQFQIGTIQIDNPSNAWLYIPIVNRWIAPNTIGYTISLPTTTQRIIIRFVAAPAGGVASVQTGGPIVGFVTDEINANDVSPLDYSLVPTIANLSSLLTITNTKLDTLNTSIVALQASIDALRGGWGVGTTLIPNMTSFNADSATHTLIAATAAKSNVMVVLDIAWNLNGLFGTKQPRGWLQVALQDSTGNVWKLLTLSPEHPTIPVTLPPGGYASGVNKPINVVVFPVGDTANQLVSFSYCYFQQ